MKNNKFGNRSRNRKDSSRGNSGDRDSRRPSLHDAVCNECGKDCRVPFKPSSGKPIYCSDCFERKGGMDSNRSSRRGFHKRNFDSRDSGRSSQNNISDHSILLLMEKIELLNTKLGTIINLLSSVEQKKSELVDSKIKKNADLTANDTQENIEVQSDNAAEPDNEPVEDQTVKE